MIRASIDSLTFKKVDIDFSDRKVLSYTSFDFPMNGCCRFVFRDDIDKFFFFHAISQIAGFKRGEFLFNNENVLNFSFEEFLKYRLNIGYGFSTRGLLHNRTLRENVILPVLYHHMMEAGEANEWVDYLFDYFQISEYQHQRPAETATSTQKATLLIRAFVHRPELIILDSPESLLSKKSHANLLQIVDEFRKNYNLKHLYFATQDEELSDCLADTSVLLNRGRLRTVIHRKSIEVSA